MRYASDRLTAEWSAHFDLAMTTSTPGDGKPGESCDGIRGAAPGLHRRELS
jgi:hypothetical protein